MEEKGIWKRVKFTIHRWYVALLSLLGVRQKEAYENEQADSQSGSTDALPIPIQEIPSFSSEEYISTEIISKRLEHLSKKRLFSVRKNGNRAEWKVRPAKFVDAYLFLLSIPHVEISQLQYHRRGDKTVIRTSFHDCKRQLELTSKKTLGENKIFICLTEGKECLLTIHFINDH